MRLYLCRHGETEYNAIGRVQGHSDVPLNDAGCKQVASLGRRLAELDRLDHIYASDIRRTVMSAEIIAKHTGHEITYNPLFRERDPGDLADKTHEEAMAFFTDPEFEPPNGESVPVFAARVRAAVDHLIELEGSNGRHVALVTHGMFCRAFVDLCLNLNPEEIPSWPNACLSIIDYDGNGKWDAITLADASHTEQADPNAHATGA